MMSPAVPQSHPAVLVTAGLFCILVLQMLAGAAFWTLCAMLLLLAAVRARMMLWRMLRRSRWILLSILLLFAWQTPGRALLADFWRYSPTHEGVALAALHSARLAGMVAVVVLLMRRLEAADWVAGLHMLLAPLRRLGVPTARFSVRLSLVLQAVGAERNVATLVWRDFLEPSATDDALPEMLWAPRALSGSDKVWLGIEWAIACGALIWLALR